MIETHIGDVMIFGEKWVVIACTPEEWKNQDQIIEMQKSLVKRVQEMIDAHLLQTNLGKIKGINEKGFFYEIDKKYFLDSDNAILDNAIKEQWDAFSYFLWHPTDLRKI